MKGNGTWRSRYNHELYKWCNEPDIMKVIKVGRLRWLGQFFRMQEQNPWRKLTLLKPEGTPWVGRTAARWLDSVEEDLKKTGVWNWRRNSQNRAQWRAVVKETKVHHGV
jgi:hypothetical protein